MRGAAGAIGRLYRFIATIMTDRSPSHHARTSFRGRRRLTASAHEFTKEDHLRKRVGHKMFSWLRPKAMRRREQLRLDSITLNATLTPPWARGYQMDPIQSKQLSETSSEVWSENTSSPGTKPSLGVSKMLLGLRLNESFHN